MVSKVSRKVVVIKHAEHEGLGTFAEALRSQGCEIRELLAPAANSGDWAMAGDAEVLFVMGGAMGVYEADRYPFLAEELKLLKTRIAEDRPTFGVCLGAQLIAEAAGGKVKKSGRHEIGWFRVEPATWGKVDPLLMGLEFKDPVFHWHGDTFDLPVGAVHLLKSDRFEQQGFRLGKAIYAIQFHPEVSEVELPLWIASEPYLAYGQTDDIQSKEEILAGGKRYGAELKHLAGQLVGRFLVLIS